jgi:hypothetical protein
MYKATYSSSYFYELTYELTIEEDARSSKRRDTVVVTFKMRPFISSGMRRTHI